MARPRKDDTAPEARKRIIDAFWQLLQTNDLHEISIGMITAQAHCNRGTFYYHYSDRDALIEDVIDTDLLGAAIPQLIFSISTNAGEYSISSILSGERLGRLALFMHQGGAGIAEQKVKAYLVGMWTAVLCPDGSEMSDEARLIVEYCSSAMLGTMAFMGKADSEGHPITPPTVFLMDMSRIAVTHILQAQNMTEEDLRLRLSMLKQLSRLMKENPGKNQQTRTNA